MRVHPRDHILLSEDVCDTWCVNRYMCSSIYRCVRTCSSMRRIRRTCVVQVRLVWVRSILAEEALSRPDLYIYMYMRRTARVYTWAYARKNSQIEHAAWHSRHLAWHSDAIYMKYKSVYAQISAAPPLYVLFEYEVACALFPVCVKTCGQASILHLTNTYPVLVRMCYIGS